MTSSSTELRKSVSCRHVRRGVDSTDVYRADNLAASGVGFENAISGAHGSNPDSGPSVVFRENSAASCPLGYLRQTEERRLSTSMQIRNAETFQVADNLRRAKLCRTSLLAKKPSSKTLQASNMTKQPFCQTISISRDWD